MTKEVLVYCLIYFVHCPLSIIHCTFFSVHCLFSIVHCSYSIIHCPLSFFYCLFPSSIVHCTIVLSEMTLKFNEDSQIFRFSQDTHTNDIHGYLAIWHNGEKVYTSIMVILPIFPNDQMMKVMAQCMYYG